MPRIVLLSFTTTLDLVANRSLTEEDLRRAIFCFGCGPTWPYADPQEIIRLHGSYQREPITAANIQLVAKHLREAERDGRVVWRMGVPPQRTHAALSAALRKYGLEVLNPNLPPIDDNDFLKTAIERTNNKHGQRVAVIAR